MSYEVLARVIERLEALADETDSRADHELLLEELDLLRGMKSYPVEALDLPDTGPLDGEKKGVQRSDPPERGGP